MRRVPWVVGALLVIIVLGALVGVTLGPAKLDIHRLLSALVSRGDDLANTVVWDLRMPRVAAALLVGACLGVSGCLLQSSTRNPLGDPQLFGVGGGAAVVQALSMAGIIKTETWGLLTLSVLASLCGAGAIALFASRQGMSPARLALIGVSLSALLAAAVTGVLAEARVFTQQSISFIGGSFTNRAWQDILPALPFFGLGLFVAAPAVGNLNALVLGDRVAANMGAEPARTRVISITAAGVLGGTAVAVAGLVGFVGLLVPHLSRLLVGHDIRAVFVMSIPLGAAITLYADQAARLAFMPSEIPAGLVTALVGAPLMIYVARRVL